MLKMMLMCGFLSQEFSFFCFLDVDHPQPWTLTWKTCWNMLSVSRGQYPGPGMICDGKLIGWEKSFEDKLNENGCDHLTYSMAKYYRYQKKGKKRFDEWLYFIPRLNSGEDDDERHDDLGFLRRTKILNYLLMLFCLFLIVFVFFVFCWLPNPWSLAYPSISGVVPWHGAHRAPIVGTTPSSKCTTSPARRIVREFTIWLSIQFLVGRGLYLDLLIKCNFFTQSYVLKFRYLNNIWLKWLKW